MQIEPDPSQRREGEWEKEGSARPSRGEETESESRGRTAWRGRSRVTRPYARTGIACSAGLVGPSPPDWSVDLGTRSGLLCVCALSPRPFVPSLASCPPR
eukprot:scaffold13590_cov101-Isochrysis_galbana.AAC.1